MQTKKSYYDGLEVELEPILIQNGMLDELFYLKDLQRRKLFLSSEIDQSVVAEVVKHILQYNAEDASLPAEERKPILLYLTSIGGEVDSGFELIDVIQSSVTPVYTINLGYQYSMGFLIGLAGHKRFAMPNAKFLMHDGSTIVYNSTAKARDQMAFAHSVEERIKQYILSRSNLSEEEYDSKLRVEWYLFAEEAREKGFVDAIIGQDCSLSEII